MLEEHTGFARAFLTIQYLTNLTSVLRSLRAHQRSRRRTEMLLSRSGHWLLSRRLLSHRSGRRWPAHGLRESHTGISRFFRARRKRSGYATPGMGVPRADAGRQMVCLRHALEKCAG